MPFLITLPLSIIHAFPHSQPDLPYKGGVLLIVLIALVALTVLVALLALVALPVFVALIMLVWAVFPKGVVFEHGSLFGGRLTKAGVLMYLILARRSFDQAGGLGVFRARSGLV